MLGVERDPNQDLIPLISLPAESCSDGDLYSHEDLSLPQPGSLLGQELYKFFKLAIGSQSRHPPSCDSDDLSEIHKCSSGITSIKSPPLNPRESGAVEGKVSCKGSGTALVTMTPGNVHRCHLGDRTVAPDLAVSLYLKEFEGASGNFRQQDISEKILLLLERTSRVTPPVRRGYRSFNGRKDFTRCSGTRGVENQCINSEKGQQKESLELLLALELEPPLSSSKARESKNTPPRWQQTKGLRTSSLNIEDIFI
ncbi:hypothetical protein DUI87_28071 [Hirundo rustica rustica]|uniref:Uncharacterized protein n=1 Tax=Hirundo rustica rustica TaxID=333673 RepID=A0A3M0J9F9_HIRRU|nr:hypothetical protein DUI87_28071 [Hirundo rustica rustica]